MAASGVLLATLGGLAGACVALGILAVGLSMIFAASAPWLDETFGELNRGLAYGGLNLIFALGYTLGPLAGGWLLSRAGAETAYALIAVTSVLVATLLAVPLWRRSRI